MKVKIGTEAAQIPEKEYINGTFLAVWLTPSPRHTVPKIRNIYSQKWNCAASFQISTFMYLEAIYIYPR